MDYCKTCQFYDPEYDELRQSGDDILVTGQEDVEKHYCRMYAQRIDPDIISGKKRCEFHIDQ